jgi:small subunit ribosomal protein S15e
VKNASNCDHLENRDSKAGSQIKLPYKNILNFRLNPHGMVYFEYSLWSTLFFGGLEQKREAPDGEKPEPLRTHLTNMIIVPEMIGHYLSGFSVSYKPVMRGRPGIGATRSFRFIPL